MLHCVNIQAGYKSSGFILVTTLIFLSILTMLVLSASENDILETKMNHHDWNELIAETAAESQLAADEMLLLGYQYVPPDLGVEITNKTSLQNIDICGRSNYLIEVTAHYQQSISHLQSLYQVQPDTQSIPNCIDNRVSGYRVWWQWL